MLDDQPTKGYKIKELLIKPGLSLSDQMHEDRTEQWLILEGVLKLFTQNANKVSTVTLYPGLHFEIPAGVWHKATNVGWFDARVLEVQWGSRCVEEDILRRD